MNPFAATPPRANQTLLPVAIALDTPCMTQALALACHLDPMRCRVKVGKTLFTAAGPKAIEALQKRGFDVFLDLKYHDIPATVAEASRAAADLGVWMFNIHAQGGSAMMAAARQAIDHLSDRPKLIAVTLLTSSTDQHLHELGIQSSVSEYVLHLAQLAHKHGCDGVVCSAHEVAAIKAACGADFLCVTPGIRPSGSPSHDQQRIMTPQQALHAGSDCLVMGRSIIDHPRPMDYLEQLCAPTLP